MVPRNFKKYIFPILLILNQGTWGAEPSDHKKCLEKASSEEMIKCLQDYNGGGNLENGGAPAGTKLFPLPKADTAFDVINSVIRSR